MITKKIFLRGVISAFFTFCLITIAMPSIFVSASTYTDGNFEYAIVQGIAKITGYNGNPTAVVLPLTLLNPATDKYVPVEIIGQDAFANKTSITTVTIHSNIKTIEKQAFYGCTSLSNTNILTNATSLSTIGERAFQNCNLSTITIPSNVITIEQYAFYGCKFSNVTIPANVTTIGYHAFANCTQLSYMTFLRNNNILNSYNYDRTFINDSTPLTHIYVPVGMYTTYSQIFTEVWVNFEILNTGSPAPYTYTISNNQATITSYNVTNTRRTLIVIPNKLGGSTVTAIGDNAFNGNLNVINVNKTIEIPNTVTYIGESAFDGCYSISKIILPSSLTTIKNRAFASTSITSLDIPSSVTTISVGSAQYWETNGIVADCYYLSTVTLNRNAGSLSQNYSADMFANSNITTVKVPSTSLSYYVNLFRFYSFTKIGF